MRKLAARHAFTFSIAAAAAAGLVAVGAPATAAPTAGAPVTAGASAATGAWASTGRPSPGSPPPTPTSVGTGGAVASVDADASAIGLRVLADGGNAVDAAVATAAALGVTEPYSAGIGGGGYFVYFDAATGTVHTIDGRETAPAGIQHDAFIDPATGQPYPFSPQLVSSGVAVGVPGTAATWETALDEWGTTTLKQALKPSIRLAREGFTVDATFRLQTQENQARFAAFPATAALFLPGGQPPAVGTTFRNPDLAKTLQQLSAKGADELYTGKLAAEIVDVVQDPPKDSASTLPAPAGSMTLADLAGYEALLQEPTHVEYRGLDVYGMAPSSSGGTTVGESLNILENHAFDAADPGQTHHLFFEATARAFADRGAYVGDPAFVDVPTDVLLSQDFADARWCTIDPDQASPKPVAAAPLDASGCAAAAVAEDGDTENLSTTHLSVVDRWGNAVAYTLTIEQTGGSGITVPGRGFLLNNELTDFSTVYDPTDPNHIGPGKRPRSSMSPTIVVDDGEARYVVGSPGGSTIITTVAQVLLNRIDLGMPLPEAVAAPRATQRNGATTLAEQAFIDAYADDLAPYGQALTVAGAPGTSAAQIGAVAAIEVAPDGTMTAAAEPVRRGGGTGLVVDPAD
ncbi:gamma-glutamyltransferase [Agromyces sp. MMS24-K17]|uniref:gamma-glutamyltransferase n=1 Tax=Agromyces sp. MMS24-K17 TaxID=3372850 RepID=UPI0037552A12